MNRQLIEYPQAEIEVVETRDEAIRVWVAEFTNWTFVSAPSPMRARLVRGGAGVSITGTSSTPDFLEHDDGDDEPLSEQTVAKLRRAISDFESGNTIERPLKPPSH